MTSRLHRVLRPRTIAIIGGGFWCENAIAQCQKMGFAGPIWPVHPKRSQIAGVKCAARLDELPEAPDAVFVGVNRHLTIDIVGQLSQSGAGGAVCFAAGFTEAAAELADGPSLQADLLKAAGAMPILGPNCYGFINYLDGALLWPDQQGGKRVDRGVAIVTQSSNIAINMTMGARGLDLAYVVTAGNQASVDLSEIGLSLLEDSRVTALGLHIEGVGDVAALEAMVKQASALGKPVVVLKVGSSDAAQAATISHTASLAGSEAGARALFGRLGFAQVNTVEAFLEALKISHVSGFLGTNNIASMSCSGGEASLMADLAERAGLAFPDLAPAQCAALREVLGGQVRLANPLDYNTYIWPDTARMAQVFAAMMSDEIGIGVVVLDFPRVDRCSDADWAFVVDAVEQAKASRQKPFAIMASMAENMPEHWAEDCIARGIIPLCGMGPGLEAIAAMGKKVQPAPDPILLPRTIGPSFVLGEADAKARLAAHGLETPQHQLVRSDGEAIAAAENFGFPVVVKGVCHAHKTEAGAVHVGPETAAEVRAALASIGGDTWLVEKMMTDCVVELLVGVMLDSAHGFVLTIGAGGQLTEVMADTEHLLLPVNAEDIGAAMDRLRIAPLLRGYRGKPPANRDAIIGAVLAVQDYVVEKSDQIVEVEINPLIAGTKQATAVDALIVTEEIQ